MLQVFSVTFPFFALVLAGWLAARHRLLPLEAIGGLNSFVLYFALPAMLYRLAAATPLAQLFNLSVLALWLGCGLAVVALALWLARRGIAGPRLGWNDAAFGALVAAFPNTGFMGVPLLVALLGPSAAGTAIVVMVVDMVVTTSLCIALSRLDSADQHGTRRAAAQALRGVLRNPMPWAIALGALSAALDSTTGATATRATATGGLLAIPLLAPLGKTVALLADAASPTALFTIGAVLARAQMQPQHGSTPPTLGSVLPAALIKLLVHPLLVGAGGLALLHTSAAHGLPPAPGFDRFTLTVMVLLAALPSASNVSLLAERFGADNGRIARIILVTTAAAFVTFSAAVAVLA